MKRHIMLQFRTKWAFLGKKCPFKKRPLLTHGYPQAAKTGWKVRTEKDDKGMKLEELKTGLTLTGLEPSSIATVAALIPVAEGAVQVIYKTPNGVLKERLLSRAIP